MHDLVYEYAGWMSDRYAPSTVRRYHDCLARMAAWLAGCGLDKPAQIHTEHLTRWLDETGWGPSQRNVAICAMRGFFRWSVGQAASPAETIRFPKREIRPQRTLKAPQVRQLLHSLDTSSHKGTRDLALILTLLDTGIRSSEICRLSLTYLDMEGRSFHVRVKGGRWQQKVFSPYTQTALARWLPIRDQHAHSGITTVFVSLGGNTPGRPLTRYGLQRIIRLLGLSAGIGTIAPHDFRRTFAVLALQNRAPTRVVQLQAGWSDLRMVERYSQTLDPSSFDPYSPVMSIMEISDTEPPSGGWGFETPRAPLGCADTLARCPQLLFPLTALVCRAEATSPPLTCTTSRPAGGAQLARML